MIAKIKFVPSRPRQSMQVASDGQSKFYRRQCSLWWRVADCKGEHAPAGPRKCRFRVDWVFVVYRAHWNRGSLN